MVLLRLPGIKGATETERETGMIVRSPLIYGGKAGKHSLTIDSGCIVWVADAISKFKFKDFPSLQVYQDNEKTQFMLNL